MKIKTIIVLLVLITLSICLYFVIVNQSSVSFNGGREYQIDFQYHDVLFSNGETLKFRESTAMDSEVNDNSKIEISSSMTTTITHWEGTTTVTNSEDERIEKIIGIQRAIASDLGLNDSHDFLAVPFDDERILSSEENWIKVLVSNKKEGEVNRKFYSLKLEKDTGIAIELKEVY